ncbi:MAG: ABC transporter substrate-binding protein [Flavobacteriales bacterium]|nr:ABC transporter substrate-binding protein [Flavobacteriales bacterium]
MNTVIDQMHRTVRVPVHPQRIISLVPSQTELLFDLGLGDRVVGITKFCVHPKEWFNTKVRVGGTKQVDLAKVRALEPDLIIGNKEENDQADIEALEREFPVWLSDVKNLDQAFEMIERVGELTGTIPEASRIHAGIRSAFEDLQPLTSPLSAAYFIWQKPWMVAGENTFIRDMLDRCGFTSVTTHLAGRYPELTDAELAVLDPDVVLLSSEPFPFKEEHISSVNMLLPGTPIHLVDGEAFSWYGSRMRRSAAYFGQLLVHLGR